MDEVGYAEPAHRLYGADPRFDTRGYDVNIDSYDDPRAESIDSMMQRAIGEQIAEQRMIREALAEFDRRLEILERTVTDGMLQMERSCVQRIEHFERSVTERMTAFEVVLKRVVDRLTGAEERLLTGLEHNDRVVRVHLEALRPTIEAATESLAESIEQGERIMDAKLESMRPTVEAAVLSSVAPEIDKALDDMRASLETTERKIRRDVNRLAYIMRAQGDDPLAGFEPIDDEPRPRRRDERAAATARIVDASRAGMPRRRERPLRARRTADGYDDED